MHNAEPNDRESKSADEKPAHTCETLYEWDGVCGVRVTRIETERHDDREEVLDEYCVAFITEPMS